VHSARTLRTNPVQGHGVELEEVRSEQSAGLLAQEAAPVRVYLARCWSAPVRGEDAADRARFGMSLSDAATVVAAVPEPAPRALAGPGHCCCVQHPNEHDADPNPLIRKASSQPVRRVWDGTGRHGGPPADGEAPYGTADGVTVTCSPLHRARGGAAGPDARGHDSLAGSAGGRVGQRPAAFWYSLTMS
jgi:hypothetical protein